MNTLLLEVDSSVYGMVISVLIRALYPLPYEYSFGARPTALSVIYIVPFPRPAGNLFF